jgi:predicted O-methyltransferase YrrM
MNQVLTDRYHALCSARTDISDHLPTFVNAVTELDATKVIEVGVRSGVSTIAWLHALEGRGHLWSIDCAFPVQEQALGCLLLDPQGPLGVLDFWTFILGYAHWPAVIDAVPATADIVFIDANHVYEETLEELECYVPKVRPGGRVYLHDTALRETGNATTPQPLYPVRTAIADYCAAHGLRWENTDVCNGLGTVFVGQKGVDGE